MLRVKQTVMISNQPRSGRDSAAGREASAQPLEGRHPQRPALKGRQDKRDRFPAPLQGCHGNLPGVALSPPPRLLNCVPFGAETIRRHLTGWLEYFLNRAPVRDAKPQSVILRASSCPSWRNAVLLLLPLMLLAGCRQDMHNQPKYLPLRPSEFFADGQSSRKPVDGTVARGSLDNDVFIPAKTGAPAGPSSPAAAPAATGGNQKSAASAATPTGAGSFPFPITSEVLARGEERFNINCSPCHGRTGYGDGMIVRRGFPQPPSYHIDRLRRAPEAHFYDVMTNGFGRMPGYADQVSPRDRWMIIAYIRALQLSQNATVADVPADQQPQLNQKGQTR